MKISFLASHGGSSARAVIQAVREGRLEAEIGVLITNNRDSAIFHWCLDNAVEVRHVSAKTHRGEENADEAMRTVLDNAGSDLIVCSGYMKRIGPGVLEGYAGRILNIHPSLLPLHGGRGMYGDRVHAAVLQAGERRTGATVHLVTREYDTGPVLGQREVEVLPDDSVETLRARVQAVEPALYIETLRELLTRAPNRLA